MILTGLDRLLADPAALRGRSYGLLAHGAAVAADLTPAHLALSRAGRPPAVLLAPEHGFYGVEQDMVPTADGRDPWTGAPIRSLYGEAAESLRPSPEAFAGLDLLVADLQDVGSRYYTYAASAVWAAEAALAAGCDVWVLDRPNPLGGIEVEGNLRRPGFESVVGAFALPVRHGLTVGELVRLQAARGEWDGEVRVWEMEGWHRDTLWPETERPWIAPSPNVPTFETAFIYPGACLVEGTALSEGRGTTRPFRLVGAPGLDPVLLAEVLARAPLEGIAFVPTYFRPQYQKHRLELCGGVELVVTGRSHFRPYRCGVELLRAIWEVLPGAAWRSDPYEFVSDRPAVDLLSGDDVLRRGLDGEGEADLDGWLASWPEDERAFREERESVLLYPEVER